MNTFHAHCQLEFAPNTMNKVTSFDYSSPLSQNIDVSKTHQDSFCNKSLYMNDSKTTATSESNFASPPGLNDVICGRGSAANNHIGNIRFRDIVKTYQGRYRAACKADKPIVALEIVLSWKGMSPPGRFLSKKKSKSLSTKDMNNNDDGEWYEIPDEQASRKVAQRLRERTTAFDASQFRRLQREGKVVGSTQPPKEVIVVAPLQFKGAEKVSESQPLILESTTTSLDSLLEGISAITTSMGMLKEPEQATSSMFFSNVESDNNENLWGYQQVTEDIAIEENGESLPSAADLLENICF